MSLRFGFRLALLVVLVQSFPVTFSYAANKTWTGPVSGDFSDNARWIGGIPGAADGATFGVAATYTVTFDNSPNPLANPVQNQDVFVTTGAVTFASGADGVYTYRVTGGGGNDVLVTSPGASLSLGGPGPNPLHLAVDDDIQVRGGAALNVFVGSQASSNDLLIGADTSIGNGTVIVDGTGGASSLNVSNDTTLGLFGNDATLTYRDGAQGSLSALGTIRVGVDSTTGSGTQGGLVVDTDADLIVGNLLIGTAASSAVGTVTLSGSGTTVEHSGASTLTIGNATVGATAPSTLNINTGAIYTLGTGATTIRGKGVLQLGGGQFVTEGSVSVNSAGDLGILASIDINSGGFTQLGAADIVIGAATGGASTVSLDSTTAAFTTGTGILTINKTGFLDINNGVFNANGDVEINGGLLDRSSGATFNVAGGKEMSIQNGGRATFQGSYAASASTSIDISGSGSRLESTATLSIDNGARIQVGPGGVVSSGDLDIGASSSGGPTPSGIGTLEVDGFGASVVSAASATNTWGINGGKANVTFRNHATGSFVGLLDLAAGTTAGTVAIVNVESGADLTLANLNLATQGNSTSSATLNVEGSGSTVTQLGSAVLAIGSFNPTFSPAALNIGTIDSGAVFTTGTSTMTVSTTGSVSIGSATSTGTLNANGNVTIDGGRFNRAAGSTFGLAATRMMTIQNGGRATFGGSFATTTNAMYNVNGINSRLDAEIFSLRNGAQLNVNSGGTLSATTSLNVGDDGTSATLNVQGSGSAATLAGAATLTVGHAATGAAAINIGTSGSGATLTTGTGLLRINRTGTVTIGGGTNALNAGDVLIDGGILQRSGGTFNLAAGKAMTIQNGGRASFTGPYTTATNAIYNVSGSVSKMETLSGGLMTISGGAKVNVSSNGLVTSNGEMLITGDAEVTVSSGGAISTPQFRSLDIGDAGRGTLIVDGGTAFATDFSSWGLNGGTAIVTFRNSARGLFNSDTLNLAQSSFPGSTAVVTVESGSDVLVDRLTLAEFGGTSTSAILTIRDAGSSVVLDPNNTLVVGDTSSGTAVVNVLDGAALTVGNAGFTQLDTTGTINIDGGAVDLKTLTVNGGKINFTAGSLSYIGNLTIGTGGLLGSNLTLGPTKSLTLSGTTTVNAGSLLRLDEGGLFDTTTLTNNGEFFINGETATASATTINNNGMIRGSGRISGNVTTAASGDVRVGIGQQLHFTGASFTNSGDVVAIGTAESPAELRIDGAASNASMTGLIVGREAILQFDGGLTNAGSLALNLGTNDVFGDIDNTGNTVVTAGANATFYDDVIQNGSLTVSKVSSTTSVAVFLGDFSGSGGSSGGGDIFFEGDLRPGTSPAEVTYENSVYLGGGANLNIEIGGLAPGTEYDRVVVDGALELAGTLEVSLINDFDPQVGDSFDILDWTTLNGDFNSLLLPALGALAWDTSQLYTTGIISVAAAPGLPGDFNFDGTVDAADYVVWRKNGLSQAEFNTWRANFGNSFGSGSAGASPSQEGVPEPSAMLLAVFGLLAAGGCHAKAPRAQRALNS